jgi:hypothetical protein
MKKLFTSMLLIACLLSLSALAGGDIETVTTTASTDVGATVTASTVRLAGFLEGVTFKCGSTTGTAAIATVPINAPSGATIPGHTLITTNITGDLTVFPRVNSEKPFIYGESLLLTVTGMGASNATIQATFKLSK